MVAVGSYNLNLLVVKQETPRAQTETLWHLLTRDEWQD